MALEHDKPEGGQGLGIGMGVSGGGGGVWPPSCTLRPLALHCAEQWAGRVRPECLEVSFVVLVTRYLVYQCKWKKRARDKTV